MRRTAEILGSGAMGMLLLAGIIVLTQGNHGTGTGQLPDGGPSYATGQTSGVTVTLSPAPDGAAGGGLGAQPTEYGPTGAMQNGSAAPGTAKAAAGGASPGGPSGPAVVPSTTAGRGGGSGGTSPTPTGTDGLLGGVVGGVTGAVGSLVGGVIGGTN